MEQSELIEKIKATRVVQKKISDLSEYPGNPRTHSTDQISLIEKSIAEFGFTNPILIDEKNMIVAGHGRFAAAKNIGLKSVPCIVLIGLSEAQVKAYVLADNQLALMSGWDYQLLEVEIEELRALDIDINLLGFDDSDMEHIKAIMNGGINPDVVEDNYSSNLADKFGVAPFSVLNAREGWWQQRKRSWISLGIKSELGRGGAVTLQIDCDGTSTKNNINSSPG